jgi:hypothetical protein
LCWATWVTDLRKADPIMSKVAGDGDRVAHVSGQERDDLTSALQVRHIGVELDAVRAFQI